MIIKRELADQVILVLECVLERGFSCTCEPYYERDTNATIHDEGKCDLFLQDHVELVLEQLKQANSNCLEPIES